MVKEQGKRGVKVLVGNSAAIERLWRGITRAASSRQPVLLVGESGTGKTLIAHAIHGLGLFPERPFVTVDCSAPAALVESQLFGRPREELLCVAGTLFLSEVWALSPGSQSRLARILQEREIAAGLRPTSGPVESRIVAASTRDPEIAVQQGTFRRDLYARLNIFSVRVPALRDRREDIRQLAEFFLEKFSTARGSPRFLSPEAMKILAAYDWPGNVRELKECIEYACAASSGPAVTVDDLPLQIQCLASGPGGNDAQAGVRILSLAEVEKQTILRALERLNGDKAMTARVLGIGKTTLYRKLKEYSAGGRLVGPPVTNH
jgi:DNA-binding NtrC family response regulator